MAVKWFESKLNYSIGHLDDHFSKYRISEALLTVYRLIWEDFCSWYLEIIKPPYEQPIDNDTYLKTREFLEKLIQLLHPFMPFLTEEIYRNMKERDRNDYLIVSKWPVKGHFSRKLIEEAEEAFGVITAIRNLRSTNNLSPRTPLKLFVKTLNKERFTHFMPILMKLANLELFEFAETAPSGALHFIIKTDEFFIPTEHQVDVPGQITELEQQLQYTRGFLDTVMKKLNNENFVKHAPANVVEMENKKKSDAEAKIRTLEKRLDALKKN
jgi:valyl-tRNA synthetase